MQEQSTHLAGIGRTGGAKRPFQLAVECSCLAPALWNGGVANYIRHILSRLCAEHDFEPQCFSKSFHASAPAELPPSCRLHPVPGRLGTWRNSALRELAKNHGVTAAWFPFHIIPWMRCLPVVVTVHDLSFLMKPRLATGLKTGVYYTAALANALWRSQVVLAVSRTTAEDIARFFPWAAAKVCVARHGLPDDCRSMSDRLFSAGESGCRHNPVTKILFLDGGNPRKRFDVALRACASLAGQRRLQLTVTGPPDAAAKICRQTLGGIPDFVKFAGFLDRGDLLQEMAAANVLAYLSHFEGFGFPIIEGMSLGTQVVAFPGRAEKEVGGNLALYPHSDRPTDVASVLADAIQRSADPAQAVKVAQHARSFSWDESARIHLEAFREVLAGAR